MMTLLIRARQRLLLASRMGRHLGSQDIIKHIIPHTSKYAGRRNILSTTQIHCICRFRHLSF